MVSTAEAVFVRLETKLDCIEIIRWITVERRLVKHVWVVDFGVISRLTNDDFTLGGKL